MMMNGREEENEKTICVTRSSCSFFIINIYIDKSKIF